MSPFHKYRSKPLLWWLQTPIYATRILRKEMIRTYNYDADGLRVWDKSTDFLHEARFRAAYERGMNSGHHIGGATGVDLRIEWRVHTALWAASHAAQLAGDFVECGVNTGMMSLAICDYIDFNATGKNFWLFDTYNGIPSEQLSQSERDRGLESDYSTSYSECYDLVKANFSPYPNAHLVRGRVPESLSAVQIEKVAYLSLDMNIVAPEIAALEHFWPRLVSGAVVLMDDYGWEKHAEQRETMERFAVGQNCRILSVPTGQGILLKP